MTNFDDLLALWQQRLAVISTNANELSDAESTKRIRIKLRAGNYTGLSKAKAECAISQLSTLVDDYLLLAKVVDEARSISHGGLLTAWTNANEKISALLEGPSITRTTVQIAIKNRDLLGNAAESTKLTPDALLRLMQNEFEQARESLNELDLAETNGSLALANLKQDYSVMEQRAQILNADSDRPSFIEIQGLQSDPLSASDGIDALKRSLETWAAKLNELERTRTVAISEVERAKLSLKDIQELQVIYGSQYKRLEDLYGVPVVMSSQTPQGAAITMLQSWCETLEKSLTAGQWSAVRVGMSRLQLAIAQAQTDLHRAIAELQTRCAEVDEVKGRFAAYKAKDAVLSAKFGRDDSRQQMQRQIESDFNIQPLDLENLRTHLARYQLMLSKVI